MDITNQVNYNECGVCAIASLVSHYYKKDIKNEILQKAKIGDAGLNIYDFESLCNDYGISTETYRINNEELKELNNNKFFVALINKNNSQHYVIVKKNKKNNIDVYDSISGKRTMDINEFIKEFNGIVIYVDKLKNDIEINKIKIFNDINSKYLFISLLFQAIIITLSVISTKYISTVIANALSNTSYKNAVVISFAFLFIFISCNVSKYLSMLLASKQIKSNYISLTNKFLSVTKNKNKSFFNKINKQYMYLVDNCINSISNYNTVEISNFIASLVFSFVILIYISILQIILFSICIIAIAISIIIAFIDYKYKNKIMSRIVSNGTSNSAICTEYIKYIQNEHNNFILSNIQNKFKTNYHEYINLYCNNTKFTGIISLVFDVIEKILVICTVLISTFYIETKFNSNIPKIILLISLISMFYSNMNTITSFVSSYTEYVKMNEIFNNIITVGNKVDGIQLCGKIKNITINSRKLRRNQRISINDFDKYLVKYDFCDNIKIKINKIDINEFSNDWINNNIFIINSYQKIDENILLDDFYTNHALINFIKETRFDIRNIKDNDVGAIQTINVLSCLKLKNKIIYFNDGFRYINKKLMKYIKTNILPLIASNNFVLYKRQNSISKYD